MKCSLLSTSLLAASTLLATVAMAQTSAPAFPGAEGHARYTTTGGRGGNVYHVTNLNDSGTGSLRWALSQPGPRTIVFDVSGYIDLKSDLSISSNTTIAGQTAPGDGITLRYRTIVFTGCDNVICRYMRFRRSQLKDMNDGADASWGRNHKNIILDHCSFSWSIDEVASFYDNRDFTMQWCTLGEALNNSGHGKGPHSYGGIWGGKNASFHHNFIAHVQNRAPRFCGARYNWTGYDTSKYKNAIQAENVDFRNCVMYNWGNGNGCYGGTGGGQINIVNNYYKAGPGTVNKTRVTQISVATSSNASGSPFMGYSSRYYIQGNYVTAAGSSAENYDWKGVKYDDKDGLFTIDGERYMADANHRYGDDVTYVKNSDGTDCVKVKLDSPIATGEVTTHTAEQAYEQVLAYAGASLVRDAVDARYMEEARTGTYTYMGKDFVYSGKNYVAVPGIIDVINDPAKEADPTTAGYPALSAESRPAGYDSDNDGMPDEWEEANGLDKNSAADAKLYTLDGKQFYTNLEVYLNGIVEHISKAQNEHALVAVDEYYPAQVFTAGIAGVEADQRAVRIEYYTLDGKRVQEPQQGLSIRRTVFSDGHAESDMVTSK